MPFLLGVNTALHFKRLMSQLINDNKGMLKHWKYRTHVRVTQLVWQACKVASNICGAFSIWYSLANLRCVLSSLRKIETWCIPLSKVVESVFNLRPVSLPLIKGCNSSVGPSVLKPNNRPDLSDQSWTQAAEENVLLTHRYIGLPKAAKSIWAKQLTPLHSLMVDVKFNFFVYNYN